MFKFFVGIGVFRIFWIDKKNETELILFVGLFEFNKRLLGISESSNDLDLIQTLELVSLFFDILLWSYLAGIKHLSSIGNWPHWISRARVQD